MKKIELQYACAEARRFLRKADKLLKEEKDSEHYYGSKASGAVRRSSMDLTRSLTELRK